MTLDKALAQSPELAEMYKNPNYTGITTEFWGSCDAIAGRRSTTAASMPYQREANITVNVLLRELEAFNGVVIFATKNFTFCLM